MIEARSITEPEAAVLLALCGIVSLLARKIQNRRINMPVLKNRHKRNQRDLGRGQFPFLAPVVVTATPDTNSVSVSFSKAVVVSGPLPLTVESRTFVSQNVVSPTLVVVLTSGTVAGMDYSMPANADNVKGFQGEGTAAMAGTF